MEETQAGGAPGDVVIRLTAADIADVRVRVSPLTTAIASVHELLGDGDDHGCPASWLRFVRAQLRGLDLAPLAALALARQRIPDVLIPPPPASVRGFDDELSALAMTDPRRIVAGITRAHGGDVPAPCRRLLAEPAAGLAELCRTLAQYWTRVFEPCWPVIRGVLERAVLRVGHTLVTQGAEHMLGGLHPRVTYVRGELRWRSWAPGSLSLDGRRLLLVPMLCRPDALIWADHAPDELVLAYAAAGTEALGSAPPSRPDDALGVVLGQTRGRVMSVLADPATTTELAGRLELTPALVSHHVSALRGQGLVASLRHGNRVHHRLTARGARLHGALLE